MNRFLVFNETRFFSDLLSLGHIEVLFMAEHWLNEHATGNCDQCG